MNWFPRHSLRRQLVWQLLALQAGMLLVLGVVLTAVLLRADLGGMLIDPETVDIVTEATSRDENDRLFLRETTAFRQLRESTPELWFILRSDRGEVIEAGRVPPAYKGWGDHLGDLSFADIREDSAPYALSAIARRTESAAGEFVVLAGGGRLVSLRVTILFLSNFMMIPVVLLLALIGVVAVPLIIRRAFSGLAAVAGEAAHIDINRRGGRLPDIGVPSEVQPLVHAVNDALQRLDQGYERHRRFILDAAHELRTPVAILQTRLETMPSGLLRTRLLSDAGRIAALAEQLLDLQRLDGKGESFVRIDLVSLCARVAADLAPLAIAAGYELSLDTDAQQVEVFGDPGALERAIVNLVQNAVEHAGGSGGIVIRVERGGLIEVSDEGPGVPEGEREQIFEPFYRLHPRERGAGLGLNLVKEVMRRHGGYATVLDSPGGGASFRLSIPVETSRPAAAND